MRVRYTVFGLLAPLAVTGITAGCGVASQQPCSLSTVVSISPTVATADHFNSAPGDQQRFYATPGLVPNRSGCAVPALAELPLSPNWTVSDTIDVKISSAQDDTNGLATCIGSTNGAVTVTAIGSPGNGVPSETLGTATLTCK